MHQSDMLQARDILFVQFAVALILAVAAAPLGLSVALSVLLGGFVCLAANAIFAGWVFRHYRAQDPELLLLRFYGGELIKLSLALGLFAIVFATIEGLSLPALFAAYFAVQVLPAVFASSRGARKIRER
ncbi:MAG: ATP synthase subunit I [Candidatus Thiosymbion ectosymbiont of Robbea hypermnestra]|nr:ATP synthase subunit I [Candidatus Thiosymbion ectosymbiont of Robbea hypermnestra]